MNKLRILFITLSVLLAQGVYAHNFDYEWSRIIRKAQNVWDEEEVSSAAADCDELVDDIEEYLANNSESNVRQELDAFKKKAKAMENFINGFLIGRSYPISLQDFNLSVQELGAQYSVVNSSYKVKVCLLSLNGYKCLFSFNDTSISYQIVCGYSSGAGSSGKYTGQASANCVRAMTDNRDNKSVKSWRVLSMSLTPSKY